METDRKIKTDRIDLNTLGALENQVTGIHISPEDIAAFGDLVQDFNDIHRNPDAAKSMGFEDTPIIGVHLSALGSRLSGGLLDILRQNNPTIEFTGQKTSFKKPVYPKKELAWKVKGFTYAESGEVITNIVANIEGDPRVMIDSRFALSRPLLQDRNLENLRYIQEVSIDPDRANRFYSFMRQEPSKFVSGAHAVALIPSALLSFLKELNRKSNTNYLGLNLSMDSTFYGEVKPGTAQIDIYEISKLGKNNRFIYEFEGAVRQEEKTLVSSLVKCLTNGELDTKSLEKTPAN